MSKITCVLLDGKQAVRLIDRLRSQSQQPKLNDLQSTIVVETWAGNTYRSIADRLSYDIDYIKQIAAKLWRSCSQLLGENICKSNLKSVLERHHESMHPSIGDELSEELEANLQTIETWMIRDQITTMSISCTGDDHQKSESAKIDLQSQQELESLIYKNLYQPVNPNIFINQVLAALATRNSAKNSINCLIVNCYLDRQDSYEQIC
jgi:hypothetical protein